MSWYTNSELTKLLILWRILNKRSYFNKDSTIRINGMALLIASFSCARGGKIKYTVIPGLTKFIRSRITFVGRNRRQSKRDLPYN